MEDIVHLGALDWLGRGVDMTSLTPFDIDSVQAWIKTPRIIALQKVQEKKTVTIDDVKYIVPAIVSVTESSGIQRGDNTYSTGSAALQSFSSDPGATGRLAVVANTASYPFSKSYPNDYQYAFFYLNADVYTASLQDYADYIENDELSKCIKSLPTPFSTDPSVIAAYKQFFQRFGSHVIMKATFGARCNLVVWGSNKYPDVNNNWKRDVTASVQGINNSGQYDAAVLSEPQYQIFQTIAQTLLTVVGGEKALASSLEQGQYDFDTFTQWATTSRGHPAFVSAVVTEIWSILKDSDNAQLRNIADTLEEAFRAIVAQQPQQHVTTLAIMECHSGMADVGLLTPSAVVGVGGPLPTFDPTTQHIIGLSETKVRWGEVGAEPKSVIVPFYIVNDGTPIDLYVRRDSGVAAITINGVKYTSDDGDNSTKRFYSVPITPQKGPKGAH